jgi:hypothetical protein
MYTLEATLAFPSMVNNLIIDWEMLDFFFYFYEKAMLDIDVCPHPKL